MDAEVYKHDDELNKQTDDKLSSQYQVWCKNMRKVYGMINLNTAVDKVSLGIKARECFVMLGSNGAGKSTLFKMLMGQCNPSAGKAMIRGMDIHKDKARIREGIG